MPDSDRNLSRDHRTRSIAFGGAIAIAVVVVASGLRVAVEQQLAYGDTVSPIGDVVRLTHGENSGVAFGFLRGSPIVPWLTALAVVGIAFVATQQRSRFSSLTWGLILGGGLANVIDRIGDSRVTDYIDITLGGWQYPTFNVPDIAITFGVILLLWTITFGDDPGRRRTEGGATAVNPPSQHVEGS